MQLTRRNFLKTTLASVAVAATLNTGVVSSAQPSTKTLDDFVRRGYQSLSAKALEELGEFERIHPITNRSDLEIIRRTKGYLTQIKASGKPSALGLEAQYPFEKAIDIVERTIPRELLPDSPLLAIGMATVPVRSYFGINSIEEWFKQTEISGLAFSDRNAGIIYTEDRFGNQRRVYQVYYNPSKPARSVIVNIHEVYHTLQHSINKAIISILGGLRNIKGYDRLRARISGDRELNRREIQEAKITSTLHFLNLPRVQEIAAKEGVDIIAFRRYLATNIPKLEILHAILEGEAYNAQYRLLEHAKDFDEITKRQYRVIALLDILVTPFVHPNTDKYVRGIGLGEALWGRKDVTEKISLEPEKAVQILRTYIK